MHELTNAEARNLAALLIRVGRPHCREDADAMDVWVSRLSRGSWVVPHDTDLLGDIVVKPLE